MRISFFYNNFLMNAIGGNKVIGSQYWEKLLGITSKNVEAGSINLPKHMKQEMLYLTF